MHEKVDIGRNIEFFADKNNLMLLLLFSWNYILIRMCISQMHGKKNKMIAW